MYKIIGGDGNEYGPVSAETLRQWIAEGRVNGETKTRGELGEWKPLAEFAEFAAALAAQAAPRPETQAAATPPPFSAGAPSVRSTEIFEGDYQLDLGGCISRGWNLVKANFGVLFVGALVYLLVEGAIGGLSGIPLIGPLFSIANLIIAGPLMGGLLYLFLKVVRGEPGEIGDVFSGFSRAFAQLFLGHIVASLLAGLCLIPALLVAVFTVLPAILQHQHPVPAQFILPCAVALLCFIPMIYLQTSWMFTLPLIIDRQMDFWPAMKMSWKRVNAHWWQVFGLMVLVGLVNIVGVLLCCVGVLFTIPVGIAAMMFAYETIFSGVNHEAA